MAAPSGLTPIMGFPYPTPDDDVNTPRDIKALADATEAKVLVVGEIKMFGFLNPPPWWLACDGSIKLQADFPELFAKIQTIWNTGGETGLQFRLPAMSGRAVVGVGAGVGLTVRNISTRWGVEAVVLSIAQMPAHNHPVNDPTHSHVYTGQVGSGYAAGPTGPANINAQQAQLSNTAATGISLQNTGGGQNHDNNQPSIAIPMFIYAGR